MNYRGTNIGFSGNAVKKIELSGKDAQDIQKVTKLMLDVIKRSRRMWRTEINNWTAARNARYNAENPRTLPLQEVFDDVMMDGHLTGVTQNRTFRTTNKEYIFSIDGVKNDDLTEFIQDKKWFDDLLEMAHESICYEHSLIWIKDYEKGNIKEVELIPRGLVIPEKHLLLYQYDADKGIDYRDLADVLLPAKLYRGCGLLEKAAPYTILKRHSWGSWDEFEELFGVPIRIAKIASQSDVVKNEVAGWLEEMGSAAYGVFPIGTEVEIKENSKSDSFRVFYMKIEALDKELSKLMVHQTMTTENGSSKAQGEVHENTLEELVFADEKKMRSWLNDVVVPAMRNLGYSIPENAKITVEQTTNPESQIKIDGVLMGNGYKLKDSYIEGVYGVEIERFSETKPNKKKEKDENQGKD